MSDLFEEPTFSTSSLPPPQGLVARDTGQVGKERDQYGCGFRWADSRSLKGVVGQSFDEILVAPNSAGASFQTPLVCLVLRSLPLLILGMESDSGGSLSEPPTESSRWFVNAFLRLEKYFTLVVETPRLGRDIIISHF